jgi:hypothetical protein
MRIVDTEMDQAMVALGYLRSGSRWRRPRDSDFPVVVYTEAPKTGGPRCGVAILVGFPDRDPETWGCYQVSQRRALGEFDHYYPVSGDAGIARLKFDFLRFTVPFVGRVRTARDLAEGLLDRTIPSSAPERGDVGLVKDLIDVANAYGLSAAKDQALDLAIQLDASPKSRSDIRELASFVPEIANVLAS